MPINGIGQFDADEQVGPRAQPGPRQQLRPRQSPYGNPQAGDVDSIGQEIPGERGEAEEGHLPVEGPGDFSQQGIRQPMEAYTPCSWGAQNFGDQVEEGGIVMSPGGMALVSVSKVCFRCPMEGGCYGMSEAEAEERMIEKQRTMLRPIEPMPDEMGSDMIAMEGMGQGPQEEVDPEMAAQMEREMSGEPPAEDGPRGEEAEAGPSGKKPSEKKPGAKDQKPKKRLNASPEDEDSTVKKKLKEASLTKWAAYLALEECGFSPRAISYYVDDLYK